MKILGAMILTAATLAGLAVETTAGPRWVNRREHQQQQRIRQGIRSDELTRREAVRLESQQARIRAHEAFARSDGYVSLRERRRLDRELDRASRNIYRQKHDRQDRD